MTTLNQTIEVHEESSTNTVWLYMHGARAQEISGGRHCFTQDMLTDVRSYTRGMVERMEQREGHPNQGLLPHLVMASKADVFNQGGDLDFFADCIENRRREELLHYARDCVRGVHDSYTGFGVGMKTIALVQGAALGGGFEAALGCQTIVAERGVEMGLPEVLFDLFPGMGAYSFLSRRVPPRVAEDIILSGNIYKSEQLHRMGVVDVLAEPGEGEAVVRNLIEKNQKIPNAIRAMQQVRNVGQDVSLDELMRITEVWVETALALPLKSLRTMRRLAGAQRRRKPRLG